MLKGAYDLGDLLDVVKLSKPALFALWNLCSFFLYQKAHADYRMGNVSN